MTSVKNMFKNKYVMILVGIFVFFMIGEYGAINTGVHDMYIYFQYPLLYIFAASFGAIPGLLVGLIGHLLVDIVRQDIWLSWISASGIMGFTIGYIYDKQRQRGENEESELKKLFKFFLVCAGTIIAVFGVYTPVMNILIYHMGVKDAFTQAIFASMSDAIITLIVVHLFYFSNKSFVIRRLIAVIVILDSLLLLSYGNRGIGSLIVYMFTIVICFITFFNSLVDKAVKKKRLKVVWYISIGISLSIVLMFGFLLASGHINNPKGGEKVVIILGAGLNNERPNAVLQRRLDKAKTFAEKHKDCIIITSGGQGPDEVIPEAIAMKNYLVEKGVDSSRIYTEDKSTTTEENLRFSLKIMKSLGFDEATPIVIVTNDFHCFRSGRYAAAEGFKDVTTLATSTPFMSWLPNYIREVMAFGKYILKTL